MLVRVPVIGTIGRAVRLNPDATVGGQIGVNIKLPDGKIPSFKELAIALDAELPPAPGTSAPTGTILESDIVDGTILARVAAAESITGVYNFVNGVTALSYDGVLAANLLDKSVAEVIAGAWEFSNTVTIGMTSGQKLILKDTNSTGDAVLNFIAFNDSADFRQGFIGFGSSSNSKLSINNAVGDIALVAANTDITGALTATSYDGILAANLIDKSAAETISGAWEFTNALGVVFTNTAPKIIFDDTNAAAEQGVFSISGDAEQFRISLMNDARGTSVTVMNVSRTGLTADQITFTAAVIRTGAKMVFDGKLFVTEASTAASSETGRGQYWVRNDVPNAPMFTNENSVDQLIDPSRSEIVGKTASYTLVIGDKGKTIRFTGTTASKVLTIPADASVAFADGTLIAVHNDGTVAMTIVITDDTLTWAKDNTTGTRTLAAGATAILQKVAGTNWKVAGSALVT